MNVISRTLRRRRDVREFERALRDASPTMRQELGAAATRANIRVF